MARPQLGPLEEEVYRLLDERARIAVYLDRSTARQMRDADRLLAEYVAEAVAGRNRRLFRTSMEKTLERLGKGLETVRGLHEDVKRSSPYHLVETLERILAYVSTVEARLGRALEKDRRKLERIDERGKVAVRYGNMEEARKQAQAKRALLAKYNKMEALHKKFADARVKGESLYYTLREVLPEMLRIDFIVFGEDLEESLVELKDIMKDANKKMQETFEVIDKIEMYINDVFNIISEARETPEVNEIIDEWARVIEAEAEELRREVRRFEEKRRELEEH